MADFIAVIRRAVDGLSNNTPEMRAKVYDKARSAVLRQLENMSPRPPEEMIRRQMDKLTAAIQEVEAEHAVALPEAEESVAVAPEPIGDAVAEPVEPTPPTYESPEVEAAPASSYDDYDYRQPAPDDYSAPPENPPAPEPEEVSPYAYREQADADGVHVAPVVAVERPSPAFATADDWMSEPFGHGKEEDVQSAAAVPEIVDTPVVPVVPASPFSYRDEFSEQEDAGVVEAEKPEPEVIESKAEPVARFGQEPRVEPVAPPVLSYDMPVSEPKPLSRAETDVAYDAWASFPASGTPAQGSHDLGTEIDWPQDNVRDPALPPDDFDTFVTSAKGTDGPAMPAAIDLLDWHDELANLPPLSAAQQPVLTATAEPAAKPPVRQAPAPIAVPRKESFDDLLDDSLESPTSPATGSAATHASDIDEFLAAAQQTAYRQEPKPRRNFVPLVLGLAVLILLGGGGYAVWANRTEINQFVSELTRSASDLVSGDNGTATTVDSPTPVPSTPATPEATAPATQTAAAPATGAPEEGMATVQKFTQRLQADGTEVDEGAAGANGAAGEGRSVAQQTVAPSGDPGPTPSAPTATPPADATTTAPPPAATGTMTGGGQERAFLYEERLGQVSPTAIVGGIEWTALRESGPDGRPDPALQGKLSIPERGLNALITFRRNNDSSLPASHLVEIVFSMPADFEGGAIDAVQRVSMKRTEQDRGDPLVGVSAKVTDDTFLIALNDFQDVVARNMDLIGTRGWIDIPITYRNGRRALLTLDKGTNGNALFSQVIREWTALRPAAPAN